jgi:thioredoxin 2
MSGQTEGKTLTVAVSCQFCYKLNRVEAARMRQSPKCGSCGKPMLLDRPVRVTDDDLEQVVGKSEIPVMVDFYAVWCGPCKVMAPIFDEFARAHMGEVLVVKLDTDRNPVAVQQYEIRGIPTMIVFRRGKEAARRVGVVPREELDRLLSAA